MEGRGCGMTANEKEFLCGVMKCSRIHSVQLCEYTSNH